jgi:hypothetical protein
VKQALHTNHNLLKSLLAEGKKHVLCYDLTANWPVAYAQACGLYCCSTQSLELVVQQAAHLEHLVQRCLYTAEFLLQTPLLVQHGQRSATTRRTVNCCDATPGRPYLDSSKGSVRLHSMFIPREIVISLAELFPSQAEMVLVTKKVYERVLQVVPSFNRHPMAKDIDQAINQLRVPQLRERIRGCLETLRYSTNPSNLLYILRTCTPT